MIPCLSSLFCLARLVRSPIPRFTKLTTIFVFVYVCIEPTLHPSRGVLIELTALSKFSLVFQILGILGK